MCVLTDQTEDGSKSVNCLQNYGSQTDRREHEASAQKCSVTPPTRRFGG